jgi:nicotinate dehydrogenase subunit B
MATITARPIDVFGASLTRRQFVKRGGALVVGFTVVGPELFRKSVEAAEGTVSRNSLDPALASSWFEIHADNTMVLRTGKCDFGQSTVTTAYKQIVAEELSVPFE